MPALPTAADRTFSCTLKVNGEVDPSMLNCIKSLTVDEDLEVGSSCAVELEACRNDDGSWPYLDDPNLQVWNRLTVLAAFAQQTEVVFDGYISHVNCRSNEQQANMNVELRAVDASYQMNQEDKSRIWRALHYEDIAREVIAVYGFKPFIADPPAGAEAPAQTAQRGSDHRFLRELARRRGYEFHVLGGNAYFRPRDLASAPQKLIAVHFGDQTNCEHIEFEADGTAPTLAQLSYFDALEGRAASSQAEDAGLAALGTEALAARLAAAEVPPARRVARGLGFNSPAQATEYTAGMLRRHGFWVRATGTLDGLRYGRVLRSRKTVTVKGAGPLYNGLYYVRKVQHQLASRSYSMQFELLRNALGRLGSEDFSGESPDAAGPAALGPGIDSDAIEVADSGARVLPA